MILTKLKSYGIIKGHRKMNMLCISSATTFSKVNLTKYIKKKKRSYALLSRVPILEAKKIQGTEKAVYTSPDIEYYL